MTEDVKAQDATYDLSQVNKITLTNNYEDLVHCILRANGDMPKDRSDWDWMQGTSRSFEVRWNSEGKAQVFGVVENETEVLKLLDLNGESPDHSSDDIVFPNNDFNISDTVYYQAGAVSSFNICNFANGGVSSGGMDEDGIDDIGADAFFHVSVYPPCPTGCLKPEEHQPTEIIVEINTSGPS